MKFCNTSQLFLQFNYPFMGCSNDMHPNWKWKVHPTWVNVGDMGLENHQGNEHGVREMTAAIREHAGKNGKEPVSVQLIRYTSMNIIQIAQWDSAISMSLVCVKISLQVARTHCPWKWQEMPQWLKEKQERRSPSSYGWEYQTASWAANHLDLNRFWDYHEEVVTMRTLYGIAENELKKKLEWFTRTNYCYFGELIWFNPLIWKSKG